MIHAYSPAKPSPLSRILTLAESRSSSGDITALPELSLVQEAVEEDMVDWDQYGEGVGPKHGDEKDIMPEAEFSYDNDSDTAGSKDGPTGMCRRLPPSATNPDRRAEDDEEESLAAQLGVPESPPQTTKAPLREKRSSNGARPPSRGATAPSSKPSSSSTAKGRVLLSEARKKPAQTPATATSSSTAIKTKPSTVPNRKAVGSMEKENEVKKIAGGKETGKRSPVFKPPPAPTSATAASGSGRPASSAKPSGAKAGVGSAWPSSSKAMPPAGGGPRRVLIDSSEAPVVRTKKSGM